MLQQLRMTKHFVVWCLTSFKDKIFGAVRDLPNIPGFMKEYVLGVIKSFKERFVIGFLNYGISTMMTIAFTNLAALIVFGAEYSNNSDDVHGAMVMAFAVNTAFYAVCFVIAMYQRFLDDYETTWNVLKEDHKE